ncbi:unnamed protein product [Bemisia tabaci]|uniref:Uncharacterized protein n=1 Tax=Bemisia tabaci TaxID=7038 RepID=A0A9P0ANI7_BEMTA|nr:unnamed protein product [Bemisia tabaci]
MTLFFDYNIAVDPNSVHSHVRWHPQHSLIAVSSFSEETGGSVTICNDSGEVFQGINNAQDKHSIVSSLAWHPNQRLLVSGWDSGRLKVWNNDDDFILLPSPHSSPILVLEFSHFGSRMITVDAAGLIVVWKFDGTGLPVKSFESHIKGSGTQAAFCHNHQSHYDVGHLAKMAVAGDETALDMFSSWRPKTASKPVIAHSDNTCVFVGSDAGQVIYINEDGTSKEVLATDTGVKRLLHHERKDALVMCSGDSIFSYFSVDLDGTLTEISQVKLNNVNSDCVAIWAGTGLLACTSLDFSIRFWHVDTGDSYSLSVQELTNSANVTKQIFTSIDYLPQKGLLCGATNMGNVIFWRFLNKVDSLTANCWEEIANSKIKSSVKSCCWGPTHLAVSTLNMVFILKEHKLSVFYNQKFSGLQTSASQILLKNNKTNDFTDLSTDLKIMGLAIGDEYIVVWSNKTVAVYQSSIITEINVIGTFTCEVETAFIKGQDLIVLNSANKILVYTFQGTIKANIECNGQPISIDLNNEFLVVCTITGFLYVWDLSRREPKLRCKPKDLSESISDFGEVMSAKSNINGSKVSITIAKANLLPSPELFVYVIDSDTILSHSFCESSESSDQNEPSARYIISHHWDCNESKLLVCETKQAKNLPSNSKSWSQKIKASQAHSPSKIHRNSSTHSVKLINLFVSPDHGIVTQDQVTMSESFISLLAVDSPNYIILQKPSASQKVKIENLLMKDFSGCSSCPEETRKAILNFGFYLCINDMDNAFKSIANVKSVAVWTSLARMCVKSQRLDVAKVCLGNMHDARGVLMLRNAEKEPEIEARTAALAIHLGMREEAELLYRKCGRYDLLNQLYRSSDQWEKAIKIAEEKDRIHLRNTYHNYAKYLESKNDLTGAAQMYEKAQTHRTQVPRMLLDDPLALERYILQSKDPALIKWWAQYIESTGDMNRAMKYYEDAQDYYSMVRIHCFTENFDKAANIANKSGQ